MTRDFSYPSGFAGFCGSGVYGQGGSTVSTPWPAAQHLRTRVNGNEEQNETTAHLIFDVPTMIEFITKYVTLEAGDGIFTGTPGTTSDMADGAICEIDISGIGVLRNPVKLEA